MTFVPRYALVITSDKETALGACRSAARSALAEKRIAVVQGDRGRQQFPTEETRAQLERFLNRAGSAETARDRVRGVAIIFHRFYPSSGSPSDAQAVIIELASRLGYRSEEVIVQRSDSEHLLHNALVTYCFADLAKASDPASFVQAAEMFGAEFADDARVSGQAIRSATGWDFPKPGQILRDLRAIHRIYGRLQDEQGNTIAPQERKEQLVRATGLVLAYEDAKVIANYRTATFPEIDNRELKYPLHARYTFNYTRIYFWFPDLANRDAESIKTLIAHAGAHLPTGNRADKR